MNQPFVTRGEHEFIVVADVGTNAKLILATLREYAQLQGGQLWEEVDLVANYEPTHSQLEEIMWVFARYTPRGYRFIAAPGRDSVYGYEWANPCECTTRSN